MSAALASPKFEALPQTNAHVPTTCTPNRFLGRQPILDAERNLFGYELLYREGKTDHFSGDPEVATREVVDHWLMLLPDSRQGTAFVNCTRNAIVDGFVTLLPPNPPSSKFWRTSTPTRPSSTPASPSRPKAIASPSTASFPDPLAHPSSRSPTSSKSTS
jgi:hypothetical protein